jgi:hypothetical protein
MNQGAGRCIRVAPRLFGAQPSTDMKTLAEEAELVALAEPARRRRVAIFLVAVAAICGVVGHALTGCGQALKVEQLVGRYLIKYPDGEEVLVLERDGAFRQEVRLGGLQPLVSTGKWSYRDSRVFLENGYIQAYDFWDKRNPDLPNASHGSAALQVTRLPLFGISLMQSEDNSYEKQN